MSESLAGLSKTLKGGFLETETCPINMSAWDACFNLNFPQSLGEVSGAFSDEQRQSVVSVSMWVVVVEGQTKQDLGSENQAKLIRAV